MSVGPRRRDNPIRDWGVQLGIIAGESTGSGAGREQRRQAPGSTGAVALPSPGGVDMDQSETFHTSETVWTSDPFGIAGDPRIAIVNVRAAGVTPGTFGTLSIGVNVITTAAADNNGDWAQTFPWIRAVGVVVIEWGSAQSGTLDATVLDYS